MRDNWTFILIIVVIADSLFTIYIGEESNPIILAIMGSLSISLPIAMLLRLYVLAPMLYIIDRCELSRFVVCLYLVTYAIWTIVSIITA